MKLFRLFYFSVLASTARAEGVLPCQLTTDKWLIYNQYTGCASGYAEISGRALSHKDESRTEPGFLAQAYGSVGLSHWLSLHVRGASTRLAQPGADETQYYHRTEQLFLQMGHPIVDSFYASVGRIDAAFGLNHDAFRLSLPSRARWLWLSGTNGGRIGFGSRDELRLEIGTTSLDEADPVTGEKRNILSGRIVRTIDLLDGARLMASYASSSDYGQRRMGFATLVHNDLGRTSLEWIRLTEEALLDDFHQVFRFVHEQKQKSWSWVLVMEDIRRDGYRLSFGLNKPWIYRLIGTVSLHYQRESTEPRHNWVVMTGLGIGRAWVWEEQDP